MIKYTENCYGCGACVSICPQKSISLINDEYGFLIPCVDKIKCTGCRVCVNVCPIGKSVLHTPISSYAAKTKDKEILIHSASGGVFAEIAKQVIKHGGVAFGAYMDEEFNVKHISIHSLNDLKKLQGSKYVQSFTGDCLIKCREYLEHGKQVVFSGTPCQIGGLKSFLGKDYDNLLTVDVICHGVPSNKFFCEYMKREEQVKNIIIKNFIFRSKLKKWGNIYGHMEFEKNGKSYKKLIFPELSYYYYYYLRFAFLRESCYRCEYAREERVSDITVGDYWGIEHSHKNIFADKTWDIKSGLSCVMTNTPKGQKHFDKMREMFLFEISTLDKVKRSNGNLNEPTKKPDIREKLLEIYKNYSCRGVEQYWKKTTVLYRIKKFIVRMLPEKVVSVIYNVLKGKL